MAVFVLDKRKKPLMPCSEKRARLLLDRGRAVVHKRYPFTIRLKDRVERDTQPLRLSIDPGSRVTGLAVSRESESPDGLTRHVLNLFELTHRSSQIKAAMEQRADFRRRRRNANLRHRPARFLNRTKPSGWLAPSLQHRVDTIASWVSRLQRLTPLTAISQELVRFDMQKMMNPEIRGVAYQQGTLAGYEVREYLLEKWGRQCAYCGDENVPLEIEHITAKSQGGSDRINNLSIACRACNQSKGALSLAMFFEQDKGLQQRLKKNGRQALTQLKRVEAVRTRPLHDAAAVNATRWALHRVLKDSGLTVSVGSGGQTKYNRQRLTIPKTHALDAVCVGKVAAIQDWQRPVLAIKATGRGSHQRTRLTRYGFPRGYLMREKKVKGFQTGDMVKAVVTKGTKMGTYVGRVAIRKNGYFNIQTAHGIIQGINWQYCHLLCRGDGYGYSYQPKIAA